VTRVMLLGAAIALGAIVLPGCTEGAASGGELHATDGGAPADAGAVDASAAAPPPTPQAPATQASASSRAPLELLKLALTTGVEKKVPVDTLDVAAPGERVYAHLTIRNRSGERRKVHVDFLVNGKLRTPLELDVEPSWSYRTWGYNTLQASDRGELEVRVLDESGATIATSKLPIRAKAK
jgi:hypothetical protein